MILQELKIAIAAPYKDNAGEYEGKARFSGEAGDVTLNLTPAHCNQIFEVCADSILSTAKEAAHNLTCNVIEHQKHLESDA